MITKQASIANVGHQNDLEKMRLEDYKTVEKLNSELYILDFDQLTNTVADQISIYKTIGQ
jgi:hypothetical protein